MATSKLDKIFEGIQKHNKWATTLKSNTLSNITDWVDTGCYALNAITSGSLYGGVPSGRVVVFEGEESCGKTFIINKILGNAQRKGREVYIFDSENSIDASAADGVGLDSENVRYVPVETIEETQNSVIRMLDEVSQDDELFGKFAISIDSLGNLVSEKEINDVANDKSASDMGLRAKKLKTFMKMLTHKAAKSNTLILCSNHVYCDPAALHPSIIKNASGGLGLKYAATIRIQLAKRPEAQDEKNSLDIGVSESKKYTGTTLRMLTVKNRVIVPYLASDMYLNFKTGLDRYSGLKEMAISHGVIEGTKTYSIDGENLGYYRNWRHDEEAWNKILPKLEEKIKTAYRYGKGLDEMVKYDDRVDDEEEDTDE